MRTKVLCENLSVEPEQLRTDVVDATCVSDVSESSEFDETPIVQADRTTIEKTLELPDENPLMPKNPVSMPNPNGNILPRTIPLPQDADDNWPHRHEFSAAPPDLSNAFRISDQELMNSLIFVQPGIKHELILPHPGDILGTYRIEELIGEGGFGAVYRAKNISLGRDEAIKVILPSAKADCQDIEKRFAREIDIISRLEHPNVMRLYNRGVFSGNLMWMATELIHGDRLDQRLMKTGAMDYDKARNLMLQLLSGLMEAHHRYIIHRDLKPSNIMLSQKEGYADQVIILDFGLSKAIGEHENAMVQQLTQSVSRRVYGTPQYMAPEQFRYDINAVPGPWTDVYAAGLIFYEMLTGKQAVTGLTLKDVVHQQIYGEIEFPAEWDHKAVKRIIQKACAKNPSERYKDAGELFDDLQMAENLMDGESVLQHTGSERRPLNDMGMTASKYKEFHTRKTNVMEAASNADKSKNGMGQHKAIVLFVQYAAYLLAVIFIISLVLLILGHFKVVFE